MSRIDELIADHCPDGVEFKTLGEVVQRVSNIHWEEVGSAHFDYIDLSSVDRVTHAITTTEVISAENAPSRAQQVIHAGDVLFGTTRPMLKRYTVVPDVYDRQIASTGFSVLRPKADHLLGNFLFHTLGTSEFYSYVKANERGASYPAISNRLVKEYRMAVPPLAVQCEIVRVLDKFTQLEAELEAELEARLVQYEHYRTEFLTFGEEVPRRRLDEVAAYANGKAHEKLVADGAKIPLVTARFISRNGEANRYVPLEDVLTPGRIGDVALVLSDLPNGRALARTFFVDRDAGYAINQRVARITVKDPAEMNPKFLHFVLDRNRGLLKHDNGVDQTHLSKGQVTELMIPVPSIDEQNRIVDDLERFHALVTDSSVGLPAELAARRKQYEHYSNRLLTFKELAA